MEDDLEEGEVRGHDGKVAPIRARIEVENASSPNDINASAEEGTEDGHDENADLPSPSPGRKKKNKKGPMKKWNFDSNCSKRP
ncbi:hypothetical protein MMC21_002665 [Puttea exsequens]|nr:hypothetical protein [Puttea exsequens]